ncbi:MAG TPA: hypothetical protein VGI33_09010 [Paenibacillus sp.]
MRLIYPTIKNGIPVGKSVWGGVQLKAQSSKVSLKIGDASPIVPDTIIFRKGESLYYLTVSDDTKSESLSLKNND